MLESRAGQEAYMLVNKALFNVYFEGNSDKEALAIAKKWILSVIEIVPTNRPHGRKCAFRSKGKKE